MSIIYRSWHLGCECFLTLLEMTVIARSRRYYIVRDPQRGRLKIAKWRVLACS